jgi:hypothetical protein
MKSERDEFIKAAERYERSASDLWRIVRRHGRHSDESEPIRLLAYRLESRAQIMRSRAREAEQQ